MGRGLKELRLLSIRNMDNSRSTYLVELWVYRNVDSCLC